MLHRLGLATCLLLACTIQKVDPATGDDTADDAPFTTTLGMSSSPTDADPTTTTDPTTTDAPTTDLPPPSGDSSGTYLLAVSTVIASNLPLQFLATVDVTAPNTWTLTLQPLSLDQGQTDEPQQPVGAPIPVPGIAIVDDTFLADLGDVVLTGETNPITGSDIAATLELAGVIVDADFFCGDMLGMLTAPLMADLTGSTFAAVRITGLDALPAAIPIDCAGHTVP